MAIQKKHGKGRLDKWYKLAKEKGYRARAAFKLIQLNRKYGFLEQSKVVLDLCAAPGSWSQVAAETMPHGSLIIGVDLAPIKPIPKVITFQSDITTDKCRSTIRGHLKTWKVDTVLHDGAPNVGVAWVQDAFSQAELVLQSLRLATDFLAPNGTFVTKVFRSKDYNALVWIFNQLFDKVEATKPPSSRDVSAEIFVVCRGFKAPKRIDPKFLDPRTVFAELAAGKPNMEAKVFNPAEKRRKREGYEEEDYLQFKETNASEFIATDDPISMLGTYNKFKLVDSQNNADNATLQALEKLEITTTEIRACCADLKVLGRKDFKNLLKWRLRARDILGFGAPKDAAGDEDDDEKAQVEPMDEELELQKHLQDLADAADSRKKRTKRRENEQKRKEIIRMELNMEAPMDIGIEQSTAIGEGAMFSMRNAEDPQAIKHLSHGRMATITPNDKPEPEPETESEDDEEDRLDTELDQLYEQYQERKAMIDPKSRSKRLRTEDKDGEWHGIESNEEEESDELIEEEDGSDDEALSNPDLGRQVKESSGLSRRAQSFFSQDLFKDIDGISNGDEESDDEMAQDESAVPDSKTQNSLPLRTQPMDANGHADGLSNGNAKLNSHGIQEEANTGTDQSSDEEEENSDWDAPKASKEPEPSIEIITAEAMTLAQQIASGQRTSLDVIDDGFNKYAFRDVDGLPEWFLDDEGKHSMRNRPITATGAAAIKEKQRLLNARPIKKVMEARGRKKMRAARRLEKLRRKSSLLAEDEGISERDKAQGIARIMSKASKKQTRPPVKLVVARGGNRGVQGRPRGVKGRYKIVDPRLKKDARALKRVAKAKKR